MSLKKRPLNPGGLGFFLMRLLTKVKGLHDLAVSLNVFFLQIIEELTTFTYEAEKSALCVVVLLVGLQVFRQVSDTVGKQSNLTLRRAGVTLTYCKKLVKGCKGKDIF